MAKPAYAYAWQQLSKTARRVYPPTCHLCRDDIDLTLDPRHPDSWTLDHLDPALLHGARCPQLERVRPAHRRCNSARGARPVPTSPRTEAW